MMVETMCKYKYVRKHCLGRERGSTGYGVREGVKEGVLEHGITGVYVR